MFGPYSFACMLFRRVSVYLKEVLINCQYLKPDSEFVFSWQSGKAVYPLPTVLRGSSVCSREAPALSGGESFFNLPSSPPLPFVSHVNVVCQLPYILLLRGFFPCGRVRRKIISHIHDRIRCEENEKHIQIPSIYTIHSHYLPSLYTWDYKFCRL